MKTRILVSLLLLGALRGFAAEPAPAPMTKIPLTGFTSLFNGKDMKGWHWSRTVRHGTVGGFRIEGGAMALFQNPFGQGGLLLTDKRYKNFEFYVETDIQPGFNSGIFLRSTVSGYAYQLELTGGQSTTDLMVESYKALSAQGRTTRFAELWNPNGWNSVRVRMTGDDPTITCWLNDTQLWEVQVNNAQIAGETDGFIGLQLHWTFPTSVTGSTMALTSWKPDAVLHFRNIFVKEL
jgi:hypothetical protein